MCLVALFRLGPDGYAKEMGILMEPAMKGKFIGGRELGVCNMRLHVLRSAW